MNTVSVSPGAIVTPPPSTISSSSRFCVIASTRLITLSGSTLWRSQVNVLAKARNDGLAPRTRLNSSSLMGEGKQLSSFSPRPDSENRRAASSSHVSRHDRMIERMRASSMSAPTSLGRKQALKQVSPLAAGALASNAKNMSIFIFVDARPKAEHDALKGLPITTNPPDSSRGSLAEDALKHRVHVF